MATIEAGSAKYQSYFGSIEDDLFVSRLPPRDVLVSALADPSLDPAKIDESFPINDRIGSAGVLRKQGVTDLTLGVKYMLRAVSVPVTGAEGVVGNGMLTQYIHALDDITAPVQLASSLSPAGVSQALGQVPPGATPGQIAARAAFGVGMSALSATGPVGAAAAAIVGFAAAIFSAFKSKRRKEARTEQERQQVAYEALPPLQEPRQNVDDWYLNNVLLGLMETGSWTPIFSPRFDPTREWVGVERHGGMAFAPGERQKGETEFGTSVDVFTPTGGVGLIPGLNRITSVVQVSLDWRSSPSFTSWQETFTGSWPVTQAIVQDVGAFYVNTSRLASVAWAWVSQQNAGVDLYKVHVGRHNGPGADHLCYRWKSYCDGGLRFLVENAEDYYKLDGHPPQLSKARIRSGDPDYVLGSAIACAIGAWQCVLKGGTSSHPVYGRLSSSGYETFEMGSKPGLGPGRLHSLGCVMDPASVQATAGGRRCLVTMYDTHIRPALEVVRKRQVHYLRHSLVCAYVRRGWDAFRDDEIAELLDQVRATLLEHPDRKLVNLQDVPRDEPGVSGRPGTWREQLLASGVPKIPAVSKVKLGQSRPAGTIEPEAEPAPVVPGSTHTMPWADTRLLELDSLPGRVVTTRRTWPWLAGAGALALGTAGLIYARRGRNG